MLLTAIFKKLIDGISVKIVSSDIVVPVDKAAVTKEPVFNYSTALAGNASLASAAVLSNGLTYRRVLGKVLSDQAGTLKIWHSDTSTFGSTADETIAVSANTPVLLDKLFYCEYMKIDYTNGATLQTSFKLVGYVCAE